MGKTLAILQSLRNINCNKNFSYSVSAYLEVFREKDGMLSSPIALLFLRDIMRVKISLCAKFHKCKWSLILYWQDSFQDCCKSHFQYCLLNWIRWCQKKNFKFIRDYR